MQRRSFSLTWVWKYLGVAWFGGLGFRVQRIREGWRVGAGGVAGRGRVIPLRVGWGGWGAVRGTGTRTRVDPFEKGPLKDP